MKKNKLNGIVLLVCVAVILAATGCEGDDVQSDGGDNLPGTTDGDSDSDGDVDSDSDGDMDVDGDTDSDTDSDSDSDSDTDTDTDTDIDPGQLTAGEWRDLDNWSFWRELFEADGSPWTDMEPYWDFHTDGRLPVQVLDDGSPVIDARVSLAAGALVPGAIVWEARTDNRGRAELFPDLFDNAPSPSPSVHPYTLIVRSGSTIETVPVDDWSEEVPIVVEIDGAESTETLDLMFMVDTTGSMNDELSYLQAELADVIDQVQAGAGSEFLVRTSVNFYRDTTDEYTVLSFPFTEDPSETQANLEAQSSDGGGDYPEAVEQALASAIYDHEWSESARNRLLFLVLDAPPHHEMDVVEELQDVIRDAAEAGIRIIPVASSGVDKNTEFLLRFIDVATGGTYVFLTDDSGIGGSHLNPTIGSYEVEYLNELMVRVIDESLEIVI